ncbi:OmpA family protein [Phyllobacterium pellucidum]|uniref:OmpA family protein n=1 Tax=Phyllobacterium pellucidum TaxID=2740464 RepID=UPI001D136BFE|nr:OmpA family protein [Phyllobacterium sp. T1018]UGY09334.1 OmpA family protein [Phyllobacterium sp. T1018]
MKRTALFFASTAILFSSPYAMAEQPPLNRPYISSNSNMPVVVAQAEQPAPAQEDPAQEELKRKAAQQAEEQAKQQAEEQAKQQAEEAKRAAQAEAENAAEQQKAIEEEANRKAAEAAKAAEAEAAKQAQEAKRAAEAEAHKAAEQQKAIEEEAKRKAAEEAKASKAAAEQAAEDAAKAKRDAEAEANKAAEQQKAIEEEARKKAAAEADAAKAAEGETAKQAEQAKKAAEAEAAKAAEAQKAAEEEARKKAESTQKAADKQAEQAAEDANKAADEAAKQAAPATAAPATAEQPAATPNQPAAETAPAKPADAASRQPAAPAPAEAAKPAPQEASPLPANAAPVLDSDKPAPAAEAKQKGGKRGNKAEQAGQPPAPAEQPVAQQPAAPAGPPPKTDADVQQAIAPVKIEPVLVEKGTRTKQARRDERPADVQVIKQYDNRAIVEVDNNIFVESSDRPRMSRNAHDVYYEDLPRRRTRETIVRENGVQIVTIRNRYGDVIQRSRITPDGREVLLTYAPDYDREERVNWRDPGDDLPPLRLDIPVRDYILDAEEAPEEEVYDFFARPPVERVERIYSVDEVKRSARIRDKVRRVDLDTITFAFGSAEIGEDQITRLDSVAKAMAQTLKKNPAETFLIEGHTDAVGSDQANLVLSDKRAESVAQALTNVFDIPPENMATQGYGERYLKIRTESPEQQNRRVAIRRITPLVAPVASNN